MIVMDSIIAKPTFNETNIVTFSTCEKDGITGI
jgi:hypothetical protein